ncbi:hypothetical protein F8388_025165 [Cannabis sativa]|uniref:Uncharacterized protein n=1 Tax=Cannabis sativa TaxID=3483 RepID=A0A7J6FRW5_CANSA|nr:hypothetical protein F8388_025165 [Cannabis sativa]
MASFNNNGSNIDNLLLQTLMGRLRIRPPNNPLFSLSQSQSQSQSQSLEDLLFDSANFSDEDYEDDDSSKTQLAKEESKLEKEIIRLILTGKTDQLKPNSGQAVTIAENHVCVGFHQEQDSEYRVWEWHGHIMLFDEDNGYTPEYIYGNYFERVQGKSKRKEEEEEEEEEEVVVVEEEKVVNLGLRELIDDGGVGQGRILHRNMNADSSSLENYGLSEEIFNMILGLIVVILDEDH